MSDRAVQAGGSGGEDEKVLDEYVGNPSLLPLQLRSLSNHWAIFSDERGLASITMHRAWRVIEAYRFGHLSPAPFRPTDRAGLAQSHYELLRECQAEFKALGCKGLVETIEAQCQRHLALCDAPRDDVDGMPILAE